MSEPKPAANQCEQCEEDEAKIVVTATTNDGMVLDTMHLCVECAKSMGFGVGHIDQR